MLDPTKRFTGRSENYIRYRPGYPAKIIDLLRDRCGLTPKSVIADIGSGTGKLSELFLENGNPLFGIEPNQEMREAGERLLRHFPNFTSVIGIAEATTLSAQSVDFVVAAQAFHWFNHQRCREEFLRILKSQGWVAIIFNRRRGDSNALAAAYERLTDEFTTAAETSHQRKISREVLEQFFQVPPAFEIFDHEQDFDFEGLKGRLLSSSYAPQPGQSHHEEMLAALKQIFEQHQRDGRVIFKYQTEVCYGHLL